MNFKKFKFKKIKSTNETAIRLIKKKKIKSGMVVAETQFKGKGQYGRKWISYKGNLHVSFFHELSKKNFSIINGLLGQNIQGFTFKLFSRNNLPSLFISPLPNNIKLVFAKS